MVVVYYTTIWYTQFSYCSLHGYIKKKKIKKHMNTVKIIIIKFDNINMISIYVIIVTKYLSVLPNINKCCIIQMNG